MTNNIFDDQQLDELLQFHTELESDDFTSQVINKVGEQAKLRRKVFTLFTLLGVIISSLLFVFLVPSNSLAMIFYQLPVYAIAILVFCIMSTSLWLLSDEQ